MTVSLVSLVVGLSIQTASAGAVDSSALPGSSALGQTIVNPDGSIFGAGHTGEPSWEGNGFAQSPRTPLVVKLGPEGLLDQTFGDGGIVRFTDMPGQTPRAIMHSGDGGIVLLAGDTLLKVRSDGTIDSGFGTGGKVGPLEFDGLEVYSAAVQDDGAIVVTAGGYYEGIFVARYTPSGEPDHGFGTDGVAHFNDSTPPAMVNATDIGIDGDGRILVGGDSSSEPVAMRLLPDGELDLTFGPAPGGYSGPVADVPGYGSGIRDIVVDADGDFRLYGSSSPALYVWQSVGYAYGADGMAQGEPRIYANQGSESLAETPGGVATSVAPFRGDVPPFFVTKWDTDGSPAVGFTPYRSILVPEGSFTTAITYSPVDDTLIATGTASGFDCRIECSEKNHMVAVKLDAETGLPVIGFGINGASLIPGNKCVAGQAQSRFAVPWRRCRVKRPTIAAKFGFRHAKSHRPALSGTVVLAGIQARPELMKRSLVIRLPYKAQLRRDVESKIAVTVNGTEALKFETTIMDRQRIRIDIVPEADQLDWFEGPYMPNQPVEVGVSLRRGALVSISPKFRRQMLRIRALGIYTPTGASTGPGGPAIDWYAPNRNFTVSEARPVRARR